MKAHVKGTVHAHSTNSYDAQLTYAELRELFSSQGLSFVCMTEHIEYLMQGDIDRIIIDCRKHSDANFVFVPGIEMDCFVIYFLGLDDVRVDFSSNRTVFDSLHAKSRMCVFSHPIKAKFDYPRWLIDKCDAVEVLNTKHDGHHYFRPQSERLYKQVRVVRPHAVALAGMDFHERSNFSPVYMQLTRDGVLTEAFVLDCLQQGAFEIYNDGRAFSQYSWVRREFARIKLQAMDSSHFLQHGILL